MNKRVEMKKTYEKQCKAFLQNRLAFFKKGNKELNYI